MIYAARFSPDGNMIAVCRTAVPAACGCSPCLRAALLAVAPAAADPRCVVLDLQAGGSGANELKIFDRASLRCVATLGNLPTGVYTIDFTDDSQSLAVGCSDGTILLVDTSKYTV